VCVCVSENVGDTLSSEFQCSFKFCTEHVIYTRPLFKVVLPALPFVEYVVQEVFFTFECSFICLLCFDTAGWVAGRASELEN